jgi:hypothetical protein
MCSTETRELFAWLIIKGRMKGRKVLFKQKIIDNKLCPLGCQERE